MHNSSLKVKVARNVHRCNHCEKPINKGEMYITWTYLDDEITIDMHLDCYESPPIEIETND